MANGSTTTSIFSTPNPSRKIWCDMEAEPEPLLFPDLDMDLDLPPTPSDPPRLPPTTPRLSRGRMYSAYAELRELHLRRKQEGVAAEEDGHGSHLLPTFHATPQPKKQAASGVAATPLICRSVPNFRAALRKENRKPAPPSPAASPAPKVARVQWEAPPAVLRTPPPLVPTRIATGRKLGSASGVSVGRPSSGVDAAARRSYACLKELKGFCGLATEEEENNRKGGGGASARGSVAVRKSMSSMRRHI